MRGAVCGVRAVDCGVWGVDCGVRSVDFGVGCMTCRMQRVNSRVRKRLRIKKTFS